MVLLHKEVIKCTKTMLLLRLLKLFVLKFDLKKGISNKKPFLHGALRFLLSYQQVSSLIGHQTSNRLNTFLSCKTNSHHKSDSGCNCIVIHDKARPFTSNILSSVHV